MSAFALDPKVAQTFYGAFQRLKPAQTDAVDAVMSGDDVIVLAGTGSGKTEAVVAPLVSRLLRQLQHATAPILLYIAPTRALVNDIYRRLELPMERLDLALGVRHGERNDLARARKPTLVVTTPESLDVMLQKQPELLAEVRGVVLDEAHLLYNSQRGMQLAILIERLRRRVSCELQVAAMSATVADGGALWSFFRPGRKPRIVRDSDRRDVRRQIRIGWTVSRLDGALCDMARASTEPFKALVFTDSRAECDRVASRLRASGAFRGGILAHHASLSKHERLRAEEEFQAAGCAVCVATSTLELGIDIGDIDLVVLWGRPLGWESFLQRIGRGNRRKGYTTVLCVVPERIALEVPAALGFQALIRQVESDQLEAREPLAIYGAACQQVLSMTLAGGGGFRRVREIVEILSPWPHLDEQTVVGLIDSLVSSEHLVAHPVKNQVGPGPRTYELERRMEIWSNMPVAGRDVDVYKGHHHLGRIPGINLLYLDLDHVFAFAGEVRRVVGMRADRVDVSSASGPATVRLRFGGAMPELDPTLVEAEREVVLAGGIASDVRNAGSVEALTRAMRAVESLEPDALPFWREEESFVYLTFAGLRLNQLITDWLGLDAASATELTFSSPEPVVPAKLPTTVEGYRAHFAAAMPSSGSRTVYQQLLPPKLMAVEAEDLLLRTPVLRRSLQRITAARPIEIPTPTGVRWRPSEERWS